MWKLNVIAFYVLNSLAHPLTHWKIHIQSNKTLYSKKTSADTVLLHTFNLILSFSFSIFIHLNYFFVVVFASNVYGFRVINRSVCFYYDFNIFWCFQFVAFLYYFMKFYELICAHRHIISINDVMPLFYCQYWAFFGDFRMYIRLKFYRSS